MTPAELAAALRAQAHGLSSLEAAVDLLINHASFLRRSDFTGQFIRLDTSVTDDATEMAAIDWPATIAALNTGDLPCSGGEQRVLRLAASLADGIPVNLRDTLTGLDHNNINLVITAVLHISGSPGHRGSLGIPAVGSLSPMTDPDGVEPAADPVEIAYPADSLVRLCELLAVLDGFLRSSNEVTALLTVFLAGRGHSHPGFTACNLIDDLSFTAHHLRCLADEGPVHELAEPPGMMVRGISTP